MPEGGIYSVKLQIGKNGKNLSTPKARISKVKAILNTFKKVRSVRFELIAKIVRIKEKIYIYTFKFSKRWESKETVAYH